VVTAGVALSAVGCGGTTSGTASPATKSQPAPTTGSSSAAPAFDTCAVLPEDVLASMGLAGAGKKTAGNTCEWLATGTDGVADSIYQYPLGQRPDAFGLAPTSSPLTIGNRKALLLRSDSAGVCGVDIALASDITFSVWVTAQDSKTYPAACDHAKALAAGAEPKLPVVS
jgi:hypothetical protein